MILEMWAQMVVGTLIIFYCLHHFHVREAVLERLCPITVVHVHVSVFVTLLYVEFTCVIFIIFVASAVGLPRDTSCSSWSSSYFVMISRKDSLCALDRGVGEVLTQVAGDGQEHPVGYFSLKLLPREHCYSTVEKEC